MDLAKLREEKLEPRLRQLLKQPDLPDTFPVIVQTFQGVNPQVMDLLKLYNGTYKDDLKLIKGFTADLSPVAIESMIFSDQIKAISYDAEVNAL